MSAGDFFLDTNILVYAFHSDSTAKQKIAGELVNKAAQGKGCISFQVVQEFINLALKKFRPTPPIDEIKLVMKDILLPICKVTSNAGFYHDALDVHHFTRLSWYDSLILQAAVETGCKTLYSEDLQDGFKYHGVTVVNPFR